MRVGRVSHPSRSLRARRRASSPPRSRDTRRPTSAHARYDDNSTLGDAPSEVAVGNAHFHKRFPTARRRATTSRVFSFSFARHAVSFRLFSFARAADGDLDKSDSRRRPFSSFFKHSNAFPTTPADTKPNTKNTQSTRKRTRNKCSALWRWRPSPRGMFFRIH